jgi:class 3 adenylate cyclase
MTPQADDTEQLAQELGYYKRQLDELSGQNVKNDYLISALRHELKQKRDGFSLLAELQQSFNIQTPLSAVFSATVRRINATLGMDRSILLIATSNRNIYKPKQWFGYPSVLASQPATLQLEFPLDCTVEHSTLLVNRSTAATPLIDSIRSTFGIPFFVCLPISIDGSPVGLLISGRLQETRPFQPPLDQGDVATLKAIAGLISTAVRNRRLAALQIRVRRQIARRKRIVDLFGQQVSQRVAEELLSQRNYQGGQRRRVAVMFLDIRNFTPFAEAKTPEEVVSYLNSLFDFMIEIIERHHGIINQFLGDGFMTTFGAPVSIGNECENAVQAALEILRTMREESGKGTIAPTQVGIGIHCGEATTGNVGSALRKQYSITGNVVILANRIEQLTKQFQAPLLISDEVWRSVVPHIELQFEPLGPVHVKGRSEPILLHKLTSP